MERKILVIDDNSDICKILECRLKEGGFEVIIARDGEEGLVKAQSENPDLILLDLKIPKLPGEEVCKEIRKNENLCNLPIIMLTAKDTDADRIVGRVVGADCYMTKPFDMDALREKIDRLIEAKEKA